jgi:hypothetical protein
MPTRAKAIHSLCAAVLLALSGAACTTDRTVLGETATPLLSWGPETPQFNLEVVLRGAGFGLVKFRQPNDASFTVFLDTWVRDLAPNTSYVLQRAVDTQLDRECTSTGWLSLGQGLTPYSIVTDKNGTGRAALFRNVPPPAGVSFDIHFRVIEEITGAVVLQSGCYQYTVSL